MFIIFSPQKTGKRIASLQKIPETSTSSMIRRQCGENLSRKKSSNQTSEDDPDIEGNKQCFIKCTERLNLTNRARKLDFFSDKIS